MAKKKASAEAASSETLGGKASSVPGNGTSEEKSTKSKKKQVIGILSGERVITESSDEAREFYNQSRFGTIGTGGKVELSLLEGLYLF